MTEKETIKIVTIIIMSYPSNEKFKDDATLKGMVAVWKNIFRDDDAKIVEFAVQKHISVSKWPPSIAEVREHMVKLQRPDIIPPDIAWTAVSDVMYAKGEFFHGNLYDILPAQIAGVVETIGWSKLYDLHRGGSKGIRDGLDRVAFMDLYKPLYEREIEQAMIPKKMREAYEKRQGNDKNIQLIENAHKLRREKDQFWNKAIGNDEYKLLGGVADDSE